MNTSTPTSQEAPRSFGIHATHYLARAEACLDYNTPDGLFYAALELRCGVEARMKQYLDMQSQLSKKQKRGYQIAKLGRKIEEVFESADRYVRLTVEDNSGTVLVELYYTPVTAPLRKHAEWCPDLLHPQRTYRPPDDSWWASTRTRLLEMAALLRIAAKGELLGVPLMSPEGQVQLTVEYPRELALHDKLKPGTHHTFRVRYSGTPPRKWLDA